MVKHVVRKKGEEMATQVDRKLRRCVLRYLNLAWLLQMAKISQSVRDRFPEFNPENRNTIRQKLQAVNNCEKVQETFGELVLESEIQTFEQICDVQGDDRRDCQPEFWVPTQWASRLLQRGIEANIIAKDRRYIELTNMLIEFRAGLALLWNYTDTRTPLVYVQVVVIAVYAYFVAEIFTSQVCAMNPVVGVNATVDSSTIVDPIIPIHSALTFLFYVGWFKVAVALMDPLGNDVQDFPRNDMFDSNLMLSIRCGMSDDYIYPKEMTLHAEEDEEDEEEGCSDPIERRRRPVIASILACDSVREPKRRPSAATTPLLDENHIELV